MKKDRLKPYVYKIKGVRNYALYDFFNGKLYQIIPDGDQDELRKKLLKENLIFETEGIVPYKITIDLSKEASELHIRELQLRLNGVIEDSCWSRKKLGETSMRMDEKIIDHLIDQIRYFGIKKIRIETDEYIENSIKKILSSLKFEKTEIYSQKKYDKEDILSLIKLCEKSKKNLEIKKIEKIDLSELDINMYRFFYSQIYNPCLGHKIAIDTNGDIKPCLWLNEIIGNIEDNNIKDLIISGKFKKYWELSKSLIEECKLCEMRYACNDCRVFSNYGDFSKENRPLFCKYDPNSGTYWWEKRGQ